MDNQHPEDIILPSLAHFLQNDTVEVLQFFVEENSRTIPSCLFPSSAKFIGFRQEEAIFRTYFHGKTKSVDLMMSCFPERYHPCLSIIQTKKNFRYYSVTSDSELEALIAEDEK